MNLKGFLIEKKNQKIFILAVLFLMLFVGVIILFSFLIIKNKQSQQKKVQEKPQTIPSPTKIPEQPKEETIQALGYSIDCKLTVTTSIKKIYVKKLEQCKDVLSYQISPSKKYAAYILIDKNKSTQLYTYSLENNIEGQLQIFSQPPIKYMFDAKNNLVLLFSDKLTYYFIPLLFSGYPENYYKELNTFTDLEKRRVEIPLPELGKPYSQIAEQQNGIALTDKNGLILFSIGYNDFEIVLSPTPQMTIDKNLLDWDKRIFFYSGESFKSIDVDGGNELKHTFQCEGIEVVPINFRHNLFSRSPDGATLAFLIPTDLQMRESPTWKNDTLSGKKIFDYGELVFYDLKKDSCQKTGIIQSINYKENFSFSPNGRYLAFVNKGVNIYNLKNHQDNLIAPHNLQIEEDSTAVTGPLVWDGESKFIYTLISKIKDEKIVSTKLVRVYFNERLDGREQEILEVAEDALYAVSSDGSKILYRKDGQLFKYNVDKQLNSLFSSNSVDKINKIVWLRDGTIISNLWRANENLYFNKLPEMSNFQIDFNGDVIVYNQAPPTQSNQIMLFDLTANKQKFFKDKKTVNGDILQFFY